MATDTTKIKLAAIGALGIAIGLFAAVVLSALQQIPADYNTAVLSSPPQTYHVSALHHLRPRRLLLAVAPRPVTRRVTGLVTSQLAVHTPAFPDHGRCRPWRREAIQWQLMQPGLASVVTQAMILSKSVPRTWSRIARSQPARSTSTTARYVS